MEKVVSSVKWLTIPLQKTCSVKSALLLQASREASYFTQSSMVCVSKSPEIAHTLKNR